MGTFGITEFTVEQQQLKLSTCGIDLSTLLPSILMPRISQVSHMDHCTTMAFRQKPRRDLDFFFILSIKSRQIPRQHTFWICLLSACLSLPPFPWSPTAFSLLFSPVCWEYRRATSNYVGTGDTNTGLHACVVSIFIHRAISPSLCALVFI